MKKICSGCGQERDDELDFSWKYKDRGIRSTRCKLCQSQISKQHYKNNKQSYFDRVRTREVLVIEDNQKRPITYVVILASIAVKLICVCLSSTMCAVTNPIILPEWLVKASPGLPLKPRLLNAKYAAPTATA